MRLKLSRSTSYLGQPWAIQESAMRAILARMEEEDRSFSAIAKEYGTPIDGAWSGEIIDGIAIIPVNGVLMRQMSFWSWFSDSSAYEVLIKDIWAAKKQGAKAAILNLDSVGGEVTGCAELSNAVRAISADFPIYAYVTGYACSAAYWIASATRRIVVAPTATLGSIGCMATIVDYSEALERNGVKQYKFISSQSPLKNAEPGTADGDKAIQATVDALADVFVDDVAENRGVSRDTVLADFGKGGTFVGRHAVDAGLADAVGSLEELISELSTVDTSAATSATGEIAMGSLLKKVTGKSLKIAAKAKAEEQDQEADDEDENLEAEDEDETLAEGDDEDQSAEDEDETTAEDEEDVDAEDEDPEVEDEEPAPASKTKAKGEKARIGAILGHPAAKGRRKLAEHIALNTNLSVKAAASMLRASAKATPSSGTKGNGFDARMRAQGNAKIGTAVGGAGKKTPEAEAAAGILATARMIGIAVKN
ncbi:hypothetical protein GHL01_00425 [Sinorhizobium meliloti]|uniref:S49 family peptidase n=1 Tax=Rhizobium meliloti TaxID=382 RepID=UPI0012970631|nr:S49 family peptidase [Sinorhizobium meliloti]MQV12210.1 hypothetical protein [Sinorhizobium meliloti]